MFKYHLRSLLILEVEAGADVEVLLEVVFARKEEVIEGILGAEFKADGNIPANEVTHTGIK